MSYAPDDRDQIPQPRVITRGYFYVSGNEAIFENCPVQSGVAGSTGNADMRNAIPVKAYSFTGGQSGCFGISLDNYYASGAVDADPAPVGQAGYRPEIRTLLMGQISMFFTGAATGLFNTWIAPHPSGCQPWASGMTKIGKLLTPVAIPGDTVDVFIDLLSQSGGAVA